MGWVAAAASYVQSAHVVVEDEYRALEEEHKASSGVQDCLQHLSTRVNKHHHHHKGTESDSCYTKR